MKICKLLSIIVFLAFVGCATIPAGPGDKPDAVPPKIQIGQDKVKVWDRPGAFGPVPSELQATGNKICGPNLKAIGYHPNAQDEKGNAFTGGGYLCVSNK
jgi:hypothetical protein